MRMNSSVGACTVAALLLMAPRLEAQESLDAARQLYASAEYKGALTMLNGLITGDPPREDRRAIALYRTLCLMAVGRAAEADRAIESMIVQDPLYRPDSEDIPPRMRVAIADARKRMLPSILQQKYVDSKAAFDRRDFTAADNGFKEILEGLGDPDIATAASQSPLSDLRVLAVGFHELSAKALVPLPSPRVAQAIVSGPPSSIRTPRLYSAEDRNVVPPQVIRQQVPAFPGRVTMQRSGVIEVIIDDTGSVESAMMTVPVNAQYDRMATSATKTWRYQPATVNGTPVRFVKRIQVTLVPNQTQ